MEKALKFLKEQEKSCKDYLEGFTEQELLDYEGDDEVEAIKQVLTEAQEAIAELEKAMKPKTCEWKQCTSEYDTSWEGSCGAKWTIEHGTPKENVVNFCPQCGGKLVEIEPKDNE